ncbi:hypothetical protein, partial [Mycobacterium simiae]|uniref:hypothetical protein n=1 Tax=Mycobacterium simiae TaxID=1784 RepID=UPI0039EA14C3
TVAGGGENTSTFTHGAGQGSVGQSSGLVADAATTAGVSKSATTGSVSSGRGLVSGSAGAAASTSVANSSHHSSAAGSASSSASRLAHQPAAAPSATSGVAQSFTHTAGRAEGGAAAAGGQHSEGHAVLGSVSAGSSTAASSSVAADPPPPAPAAVDGGTGAPDAGPGVVSALGSDQGDAASPPPVQFSLGHAASPANAQGLATPNGDGAGGLSDRPGSVGSDSSAPAVVSWEQLAGDTSPAGAAGAATAWAGFGVAGGGDGGVEGFLVSDGAQQREEHLDTAMAVPDAGLSVPGGSGSGVLDGPVVGGGASVAGGKPDSEILQVRGLVGLSESGAAGGE